MNTGHAPSKTKQLIGAAALVLLVSAAQAQTGQPATTKPTKGPAASDQNLPADRDHGGGRKLPVTGLVAHKKTPAQIQKEDRESGKAVSPGSPNMPGGVGTGSKEKAPEAGASK